MPGAQTKKKVTELLITNYFVNQSFLKCKFLFIRKRLTFSSGIFCRVDNFILVITSVLQENEVVTVGEDSIVRGSN